MPDVQKRLVPVQFGGINTKVDPKQLQAGQLLALQNGQFSKAGQINKRFGYDILSRTIEGGGSITAGVELATYKNELLLMDGTSIYSYLPATGNWSNRGTAISIITEDKDIIRTSQAQQLNPDMAYLNGMEVFAAEDSRGGIHYATLDSATKAFALSDTQLSPFGQQPKCVPFQNQIFIFYSDGGNNLYYQTVNPLNPTVAGSAVIIAADGYVGKNGFPFDVAVIGSKLVVAYLSNSVGTGAIQVFALDTGFTKSSVTVVNSVVGQAINGGFHGALNVVGDSASNIWITWANGVDLRCAAYTYAFNALLGTTLVDTADVRVITAIESASAQTLRIFYEVHAASAVNEQVRYVNLSSGGTLGAATTIRSVGLMSKAWKYAGNIYVNTAYQSVLQATDFTFYVPTSGAPVIVAKLTAGIAGGLQTNGMCPEIATLATGVFKVANNQAGKLISEANTLFSLLGLASSKLTFTPTNNFLNQTQANTLLIIGGILQGYDGVSATELGFHIYPEGIGLVASGADGALSAGTYQYAVTFEWTDNNGQIHRSAPSIAQSVTAAASNHVTVTGPSLRLTAKTKVSIVIYRTAVNDVVFHRVTSTIAPLLNDPTTDTWTFNDVLSDASAAANELLYTTGGVLNNISPPANSIITTYNNRVFLAGLSDKLLMWYSQSVVDNSSLNTVPPQFCQELTMACDPRGGDITALGLLNQALIIFKAREIFSVQGNGPTSTGANNDFGDPQLVSSDVGCINANSIVIVPSGLMFQSAKGICLIDQALNVSYIGAPVEAFNGLGITSSIMNAIDNQVIFTTSSGTSLVYDFYFKQWSTWTNQFASDAATYNGLFSFVTTDGRVYVQNRNKFTDGSSPIYLSLTTPNLAFAGIQGFQRVYRLFILGTYKGLHNLNVQVAYDYNDNFTQSVTIQPSTNVSNWGGDALWGSGPFWGGQYQIYEFRVDFNIQKCTAIRLMISDNQSSNYNEGYAISSLVFEVGALPGGNRLPPSQQYGSR